MDNKQYLLHIDGSAFAFLHGNKPNYEETIYNHLETLCNAFNTNLYTFFSEKSKSNFRHEIAVTNVYKGQREAKKDSIAEYLPYLPNVFKYIEKALKPVVYLGIENDDALNIAARMRHKEGIYEPVTCGDDSDLLCIPGKHYRLRKNEKLEVDDIGEIKIIEKNKTKSLVATGLYATYSKILKGSVKENYFGLPGYGSVKVYNLLKNLTDEKSMIDLCLELFAKEFGYEQGALRFQEGFRLCFLLRENINFILPDIQVFNKKPQQTKVFAI